MHARGPKFDWAIPSHLGRRLFECLEWHWIDGGVPPESATAAALAVAGALAGVEPDSIRLLAYKPAKRGGGHTPKKPPRTMLDLGPKLDGDEAEHLREYAEAITEMVRGDLRLLAAAIGLDAFNERMQVAMIEAARLGVDLPWWLRSRSELPTAAAR